MLSVKSSESFSLFIIQNIVLFYNKLDQERSVMDIASKIACKIMSVAERCVYCSRI